VLAEWGRSVGELRGGKGGFYIYLHGPDLKALGVGEP